jgi:hypothetical protein
MLGYSARRLPIMEYGSEDIHALAPLELVFIKHYFGNSRSSDCVYIALSLSPTASMSDEDLFLVLMTCFGPSVRSGP